MERTLVFDIDDVICVHKNRDYPNAEPVIEVIDKLNRLKQQGYYIKLYTARGQNSCHGDLALIKERNEAVLAEWLNRHGVQYDELIFGKPLGDWYIDDKAMTLDTFLKADFKRLTGGSGSQVFLEDKTVVKKCPKAKQEHDWYRRAEMIDGINTPRIYSITLDTLYMEHIEGTPLSDALTEDSLWQIVATAYRFADVHDDANNLGKYIENLYSHDDGEATRAVAAELVKHASDIGGEVSFSHGDMALSNVISSGNKLYLIDPNYKGDFSSYLLDLAKIRFSLTGYEYKFGYSNTDLSAHRQAFDDMVYAVDRQLVKLLEITHWIRIFKYRPEAQRKTAKDIIATLLNEYRREYGGNDG